MNLETVTAVYAGNTRIGYGAIIAVLSYISSWCLICSLAGAGKKGEDAGKTEILKNALALLMYLVFAPVLALTFGRAVYWYSHHEIFARSPELLYSFEGSFHEAGVIPGAFLAALMSSFFAGKKFMKKMMSASAAGTMLFLSLVSLASMFNDADRGKAVIEDVAYQRLPISYLTGGVEYRPAVFFWKFMVLGIIALFSVVLCIIGKSALYTYVCYFAAMAVLDSARYDASFLRSNGFVSLMQIVSGVFLIAALIVCTVRSVKRHGFRAFHFIFILAFLAGLGLTGYMEYYVQRHGDLYPYCYALMSVACFVMAASVIRIAVIIPRK